MKVDPNDFLVCYKEPCSPCEGTGRNLLKGRICDVCDGEGFIRREYPLLDALILCRKKVTK